MPSQATGLDIRGLTVGYHGTVVVSDVDLFAAPGKITGIAGESGSGKTTALLASIGYTPPGGTRLAGEASIGDVSVLGADAKGLRRLWGKRISYVPQDAVGSLNPSRRIGSLLREILTVNLKLSGSDANARAVELLSSMRMTDPASAMRKYPHELSGGQAQRVALALGLATDPDVLILDEPTTGLDVTTQADVLTTLKRAITSRNTAAVYISHDLGLLAAIAESLVIFYAGEIVESGATGEILRRPRHPYTRALLDAIPSLAGGRKPRALPGLPPGHAIPDACAFAARCSWAVPECVASHPSLRQIDAAAMVRCVRQPELGPLATQDDPLDPAGPGQTTDLPLLAMSHLVVEYGKGSSLTRAVDDVSIDVPSSRVVALVGESGSGKTTIGRTLAGIVRPQSGEMLFGGLALAPTASHRSREQRRDIQIIFQNPDGALNPRQSVRQLMRRSFELFRPDISAKGRDDAIASALAEAQLPPALADRYPHQLSGGQKQRVAIARALACRPRLLICDEIVSAQDVSVQAAILDLLADLQKRHSMALLFISHDLAVTRAIADYAYVIHLGKIVEEGPIGELLDRPANEYTARLVKSAPGLATAMLATAEA